MTEETYISLDKRLFELFLSLSRCLGSVEELLQRPGLSREDASAQQVSFQVGHASCPCVCVPVSVFLQLRMGAELIAFLSTL